MNFLIYTLTVLFPSFFAIKTLFAAWSPIEKYINRLFFYILQELLVVRIS